ncbi:MAG: hypothetical protein JWO03_1489 [Bacteroidetes bacterium]|nr:hypothetical protein [Bacteroidota bacterium]
MRCFCLYILFIISVPGFAATTDSLLLHPAKRKAATEAPPMEEHQGQSYFEKYVKPKSVNALISYCAVQWMQEEKDSFAAMPENVAIHHHHYWYDTWINKMWGILVNDSGVHADFKTTYGITDNEDKWLIMLTSLHRKLNHCEMDIAGQAREIKKKKRKTSATSFNKKR